MRNHLNWNLFQMWVVNGIFGRIFSSFRHTKTYDTAFRGSVIFIIFTNCKQSTAPLGFSHRITSFSVDADYGPIDLLYAIVGVRSNSVMFYICIENVQRNGPALTVGANLIIECWTRWLIISHIVYVIDNRSERCDIGAPTHICLLNVRKQTTRISLCWSSLNFRIFSSDRCAIVFINETYISMIFIMI